LAGRLGDVDSNACRRRVVSSAGRGVGVSRPIVATRRRPCQRCGDYLQRASPSRRAGTVVAKWSVLAPAGRATARHMQPARAVFSCQTRWFSLQKLGTGARWFGPVPPATRTPGRGSMPPEREDAHARQLEALRRYFAELGGQRDRATAEAAEPQPTSERQRRPSRPWLLLTGLLVVVALVGGVLSARSPGPTTGRPVGPGAPPCRPRPGVPLPPLACWPRRRVRRRSAGPTRCSPPP
jgi:hypothetical protein